MAIVRFTSTESFLDADPKACEHAEVEIHEYIEGTYDWLRDGTDGRGDVIAQYINGAWELLDGRRFSDWAVGV